MKLLPLFLGVIILLSLVVVTSTVDLLSGVFHSDGVFFLGFFSAVFTNIWFILLLVVGAFLLFAGKSGDGKRH